LADPTLGVLGWNGRRNTGDDAMASVIVTHAARAFGPRLRGRLLADRDTLPDLGAGLPAGAVTGFAGYNRVRALPTGLLRRAAWTSLFDGPFVDGLDVLVIGGGSIFHGRRAMEHYARLIDRLRARNPSARVGALGVSLGPFRAPADRAVCADALARLDFLGVRDRASSEELDRMGHHGRVAEGLDLAVLLPEQQGIGRAVVTDGPALVGIALRADVLDADALAGLAAALARLLDRRPDVELALFVFCGDPRLGDARATEALARAIARPERVRVHPYSPSPARVCGAVARCRLVVAMRLHAGVLAYATGTPFMLLAYHPKSLGFADQVGLPEQLRADARALRPDELAERIAAELAGPESGGERARLPLAEGVRSARAQLAFLDEAAAAAPRAERAPAQAR
jgi:polysaccharide pyruvyl transferase WcaK-like protein